MTPGQDRWNLISCDTGTCGGTKSRVPCFFSRRDHRNSRVVGSGESYQEEQLSGHVRKAQSRVVGMASATSCLKGAQKKFERRVVHKHAVVVILFI